MKIYMQPWEPPQKLHCKYITIFEKKMKLVYFWFRFKLECQNNFQCQQKKFLSDQIHHHIII